MRGNFSDLQVSERLSWFAVHCVPFKEWLAAAMLTEQLGLTVYLPEMRQRFRGRIQYAPFFPRYLFVQSDLGSLPVNRINSLPGVIRLVAFDGAPQPISPLVIEVLRQRIARFNAEGGMPQHHFQPGDVVRLCSGPLQGLEAVFVGPMKPCERVRILIDFLGHHREAEVQASAIELVSASADRSVDSPPTKRARRTRGKGRVINSQRLREEH